VNEILRTLSVSSPGPFVAGDRFDVTLRVPNATPAALRSVRVAWPDVAGLDLVAIDGKPPRRRATSSSTIASIGPGSVATTTATFEVASRAVRTYLETEELGATVTIGRQQASTNLASIVIRRPELLGASGSCTVDSDGDVIVEVTVSNDGDGPAEAVALRLVVPGTTQLERALVQGQAFRDLVVEQKDSLTGVGAHATFADGVLSLVADRIEARSRFTLRLELSHDAPCNASVVRLADIAIASRRTPAFPCAIASASLPPARLDTAATSLRAGRQDPDTFASLVTIDVQNAGWQPAHGVRVFVRGDAELEVALGSIVARPRGADPVKLPASVAADGSVEAILPTIAGRDGIAIDVQVFRRGSAAGGLRVTLERDEETAVRELSFAEAQVSDLRARCDVDDVREVRAGSELPAVVELWNAGTVPVTGACIEVGGNVESDVVELDDLPAGQRRSVPLQVKISPAARGRATVRIVVRDDDNNALTVLDRGIPVFAQASLSATGRLSVQPRVGDPFSFVVEVRNTGTDVARDVVVDVEADGARILETAEPASITIGKSIRLATRLIVDGDRPEPVMLRAGVRCAGVADVELLPQLFVPAPMHELGELSLQHPAEALAGELIPFELRLRNVGLSTIAQLTLTARLDGLEIVTGSVRINERTIVGDERFSHGLVLENLAPGAGLRLTWLARAADSATVSPFVDVALDAAIIPVLGEELTIVLPSAFAIGAVSLDASDFGADQVPSEHVDAKELPPEGALIAAPTDEPAPTPELELEPQDAVATIEASAADAPPVVVDEPGPDSTESVDAVPPAAAANVVTMPPALTLEDLDRMMPPAAVPARNAGDDADSIQTVTAGDAERTERAVEAAEPEHLPASGIMFALELTVPRIEQIGKYLRAAEAAFGDSLLVHVFSVRALFPDRVVDPNGALLVDVLHRVREKLEQSLDAVLLRYPINPDTAVQPEDLESLSQRTALTELVKRLLNSRPMMYVSPDLLRTWSVAAVEPSTLRYHYSALETASLGDAASLRILAMFVGDRVLGQAENELSGAFSAYASALLDAWALYEDSAEFPAALRRPAPAALTAARLDLLVQLELAGRELVVS
jgi:hypothetical protein